jgi:cell wall-associated NlpC family hydrolase
MQIKSMAFVIAMVGTVPIRKDAAHRSEMVSQLLFGELAEVLQKEPDFTKIRCVYDNYEGWCQSKQLLPVDLSQVDQNNKQLSADWINTLDLNGDPMHLSLGTSLSLFTNGKAQVEKYSFSYNGNAWNPLQASFTEESIRKISMQHINTPYLWGGRSVFGIDCSGFVQQVFRFFNIAIPRDAYQQAASGEVVGFLQEVQCGDLAFFDNEDGKITHVGLLYNQDTIIHSSGKVRVDKIDTMGIIDSDTGERTHRLRIIKRYPQNLSSIQQ